MKNIGIMLGELVEKIAYFILQRIFKVLKKELTDEMFEAFMQFVKFGIVGLSNTIISYVLYVVSLLLFQKFDLFAKMDYFIAQIISFVISVLWSFYWNNKLVFVIEEGQQRSIWKALLKTYVSYSFTGLFLNSMLLALWIQVFHISEFIAPAINLLVSVPLNFIINKFWAFKEEKKNVEN